MGALSEIQDRRALQTALLGGWLVLWAGLEAVLRGRGEGAGALALLVGVSILGGAVLLPSGAGLRGLLASRRFAVVQGVGLGLLLALGAALPSGPERPQVLDGPAGRGLLEALHAGDLVHGLAFLALLSLMALGAALALRDRPARGLRLLPAAAALMLAGLLVGRLEGPRPLALGAFLDADGKGGFEGRPQALEAREGKRASLGRGLAMEVERALPRAVEGGELRENPEAPEDPALQVMLGLGGPEPLVGTLFSRHPDGARREEPGGRFSVRFAEAWTPDLGRTSGAKAQDLLRLEDHGRVQEREAAAGVLWEQPDYGLRVVALYPDFAVGGGADGEPRPYSRSDRPLEPWLEVTFLPKAGPPRRLLFSSRQPELTDRLNAPNLPEGVKLRYLHSGGTPPERVVVFTRGDQRVRLVEEGAVRRAEPLVLQRPFVVAPGLSVTPLAQFLHAEYRSDFAPAPEGGPGRPALLVRVTEPSTGRSERGWLGMSGPEGEPELHAFFGGRLGLAYAARPFGTSRPPAEWALVGAGLALGLLGALLAWKGGGADGPEEAA